MAIELRLRRGTTAEHSTFTGAGGEVTVNTSLNSIVVHDGVTPGGHPVAGSGELSAHIEDTSNPHSVTKAQVGLGNVDNTSDANKPISTATQAALNAHTTNTSNPHSVTKAQVGLGNVDNTSDANKPVSTATQAALDTKINAAISGYTDAGTLDGTEILPTEKSGIKKTTVQKILDWIKTQAITWSAKQTFNGFTVLGDASPALKVKKITGTTAATQGGTAIVAHGLPAAKIIGYTVHVADTNGDRFIPGETILAGYHYGSYCGTTNVVVFLSGANSANLVSRPFTALITYEE